MLCKSLARLLGNTTPVDGRTVCWMAVLGLVAGGVKATMHRNPRTRWYDIVAAAVGSAFSSTLTGFGLLYAWGPEKMLLILAVCGVAGWVGVALVDLVGAWAMGQVRGRLGGDDKWAGGN